MSTLVVHPWEWHPEEGGFWRAPGPDKIIGCLDRRTTPQIAARAGLPLGGAYFVYPDDAILPSGGLNLGTDIERRITTIERDGLFDIAGITVESGDSLVEVIRKSLLDPINTDPEKLLRPWSLRISRRKGAYIRLNGFGDNGIIWQEDYTPSHVAMTSTLAVRFANYRSDAELPNTLTGRALETWIAGMRTRQEVRDGTTLSDTVARERHQIVLEKWTGYDMLAFEGQRRDSDLAKYIPPEYLSTDNGGDGSKGHHGQREPSTILTEGWPDADSDTGGTGDLTSDLTWLEVVQDFHLLSNQAKADQDDPSNTNPSARAEHDLSSANQKVTCNLTWESGSSVVGCVARFAASATTYVRGGGHAGGDEDRIHKFETGTSNEIASQAHTIGAETMQAIYSVDSNDDHSLVVDGHTELTVQDATGNGNKRCGIGGANGNGDLIWATWQGEDLAATGNPWYVYAQQH